MLLLLIFRRGTKSEFWCGACQVGMSSRSVCRYEAPQAFSVFRTTKEKFLFCGSNRWTRGFSKSVAPGEALWIFRPVRLSSLSRTRISARLYSVYLILIALCTILLLGPESERKFGFSFICGYLRKSEWVARGATNFNFFRANHFYRKD